MKKFLIFIILAVATAISWTAVSAQDSNPESVSDDEVNEVAKELYCPVCENIPLDVCGTQACADWRDEIRVKLSEGWTKDEVKQYFADRFGDRVLAAPPARGLNWLVYVIPPIAFLAGVFILFRGLQSWRQQTNPAESVPAEEKPGDEYLARLEEELRKK